jgi:hypothetical protein
LGLYKVPDQKTSFDALLLEKFSLRGLEDCSFVMIVVVAGERR